jgi:hypothetical protein
MFQKIKPDTSDAQGKILGIQPTSGDYDHEQAKRSNRAADALAAKFEKQAEAKAESARRKSPSDLQRREAALEGLRRHARRAKREGSPAAPQLEALATEAEAVLRSYESATKALSKPLPDPLVDAIKLAAKELRKVLPHCFPTADDADYFASHLPIGDARREAERLGGQLRKDSRARTLIGREFWTVIEKATRVAGLTDAQDFVAAGLL